MHQPLPSSRHVLGFLWREAFPARTPLARNLRSFLFGWFVVVVAVLATHGTAEGAARVDSASRSTQVANFSP